MTKENPQNSKCIECNGSGKVVIDIGKFRVKAPCTHCNGSGIEPEKEKR